ncbi:hypothetical protein MCHIJ_48670 [Mycolicibacterium chitae]|uniref:hypothetical protein n=1 Tax=Mycolicibacterium chitae TaxID=1792 RepID=UPI00138B8DA8|nr:hypothetical protein [Mycolicibacterium chitae]BBZ05430.1 hypothetical protein MCHIJ_48670 [Mycolicibacterium chitae]
MTERERWDISPPPGGWAHPWPLAVEVAAALPEFSWTLVGGLMVQVHAARIGVRHRPTEDIDIVLHVETDAISFAGARERLENLGFVLRRPNKPNGFIHCFERGSDIVDVMVADHLQHPPKALGHRVFRVPGSTGALQRTVNVTLHIDSKPVRFSLPSVIAALGLKGAAYTADNRDAERHLRDAAVLACCIDDPEAVADQVRGSDRGRIRKLWHELKAQQHPAWLLIESTEQREYGYNALSDLVELLLGSGQSPRP